MDLTRLDQGFYRMAHALMAHAPQASSGMHRMLPFSRDEVIRVMDAPADLPGGAPAGYLFGQNTAGQSGFFPPHLVQFFQTSDYLADQIALAQLDRFIDLKRPRPVRIGDEVLPAPPPGWRYSRNPAGRPYLYCTETGARAWSVFEIARGQGLLDAGGPALSPSTPGGHGGSLRVAVGQEPRTPGSAYASSSLTTGSDQRKNVAFLRSLRRRDHQSHDRYVPLGSPELSISFGEGGLFGGERGLADNDPTLRTMVRAPLEGATAVALANGSATGPGQPGMRMGGSPSRAAIGLTQVALAGGAGIGAGDAAADGQSSGSRQLIALTKLSMYLPSSPLEGAPGAGDLTATASPGPASALPPPLTGMSHPPAGAQPHPHPHPESHPHQPSDGMRQQQQQQQQSRSPPPPSMPLPHPVPHPPPASAQGHGMAPSHAAQLHHHHLHHLHHLHHHHHHHQQQQQQQHMYSTYPAPQHHPGMADPVQPSLPVRPDTLPGMVPGTSARSLPPPIMVPMVPAGAAGGFSAPTSISSLPPLESPSSVYMTPLIIRSPPGSGTALERAASNPSLLGGALGHGPAGGMGMMVDPARGPRAVGLPPPLVADVAAGVVGGRGPGSVGSVGDLDGSDLDMSLPPPLVLAEDATEEPLLPLAPPPKPERPSAPGTPGPRGTVHIMAGAASLPLPLPLAPALAPPALLEPAGAPAAPVAGPPPPECDLAETASCSSSPSSSPLPPPLLEVSPLPGVGEEGDPEQGGRAALSHRHSAPPSPSPGGVSGGPDSGVLVDVGSTVSARADPAGGAAAGSAAVPPPTADEAPAVEPLAPAAASRPDVENNEHYARLSQQARQITVALRRLDGAVRANRGSDSDPAAGDERPVRLSPRSHAELRLVLDAGRALVSESAARILVQATSLSAVVAKQAARAAAAGAEVPDARALFRAAVSSLERSMAELDRLLAPLCQAEEEIFGEEPESLASGTAADQPAITRNQAATAIATVVSATASVQGAAHALLLSI
ncbi:hypothetical protein H696_05786 [Fonticula alba]|uniref:Uncharacterized protein n=1 Tax=Fonticula alba TaxID=691883 RepID=A0A058Z0L4_FONAL|nr:hypothetical protein H696_05786 [Fonticula alba]KCV67676.1 hypothetical protein H696_05786 [Fonticula alba]|eukprot:XP_009497860.1 hypothetical protein H696_05786 [Fonticula alba]